jgi:hypothetical protein
VQPPNRRERHESGVTLLITVVLILLVGLLVLTSLSHTGDESVAGARGRSASRALHAADGGMQMALNHVSQSPPDTAPIDVNVGDMNVQSRTRAQGSAQNLASLGAGLPPEGYGINTGSGFTSELFLVDMTSLGPTGSTAELQSKLFRFSGTSGGY